MSVALFCVCFNSAFFGMLWHLSCAIACLFTCFLFCFFELYVHSPACLIFCSDFALCLIAFGSQIVHIRISCFSAGCFRCRFLDLSDFLCTHFRFCWLHNTFIVFTLLLASSFALLWLFLMFVLAGFVLAFSALRISGLHKFALARFRFVWRRCSFPPVLLEYTHPYHTARLFIPLHSSTRSSLSTITITADLLFFFVVYMHCKICLPHPFVALFALFLLPPVATHSIAPIRTDLYASAPTHTTFCQTRQNMMSEEISPTIGPKFWSMGP